PTPRTVPASSPGQLWPRSPWPPRGPAWQLGEEPAHLVQQPDLLGRVWHSRAWHSGRDTHRDVKLHLTNAGLEATAIPSSDPGLHRVPASSHLIVAQLSDELVAVAVAVWQRHVAVAQPGYPPQYPVAHTAQPNRYPMSRLRHDPDPPHAVISAFELDYVVGPQ